MSPTVLLQAHDLHKHFTIGRRGLSRQILRAVNGVSLTLYQGETLGLVGESGCGKSTLGRCLTRLYDITSGSVHLDGQDITHASDAAMRPLRARMQMVFQDPYASLNPRRRVRELVAEPLIVHKRGSRSEIRERVARLIDQVGLLPDHLERFPHEFSGGQRQRIGIARALALNPQLIVADEPVSALDVSVQAQIVNLLMDLQDQLGLTYLFIAHDLGIVRQIATRVAVMYLGGIVETGPTDLIFTRPAHHYTKALISAVPVPDPRQIDTHQRIILSGDLPSPMNPPNGCRFHPRCTAATDLCRQVEPKLTRQTDGRETACHHPIGQ